MKELNIKTRGPFLLEKSFTTHWLKLLKEEWFYTDKISDGSIWTKKVDCYIRTPKWDYCCEIKMIEANMFPLTRIRPNQWKALRVYEENKWTSIVVVYSKKHNKYKIIPFPMIADLDKSWSVKLNF